MPKPSRKSEFTTLVAQIPPPAVPPAFNAGGELVVCLIEFRPLRAIEHVLNAVFRVYAAPREIGLAIVYGTGNQDLVEAAYGELENVRLIRMDFDNIDRRTYSAILQQPQFWENFVAWSHVLVYQTDALLLRRIDDAYFALDYVGAPWQNNRQGGNGGFSLRRVRAMVAACEPSRGLPFHAVSRKHEDMFFSGARLKFLPARSDLHRAFSVETVPHPAPCGCHQVFRCGMKAPEWAAFLAYVREQLL